MNDGKLRLEDPVSRYLPDTPPSWSAITVRQALSHTAGFPNEAPGFDPYYAQSDLERIRKAYDVPLLSKPGEVFAYSNWGYGVVAEIIRKVSGAPWPQFMSERVFKPLRMNATRTTDLIDIVSNRANGYRFQDNETKNVAPLIVLRPSGAFLSTLTDVMKWDAALSSRTLITPGHAGPTLEGRNAAQWHVDEIRIRLVD